MAGLYLENLTELAAAPATGDLVYLVDVSVPNAGRRITVDNLVRQYLETQTVIEFASGITLGLATGAPAPDQAGVHIWRADSSGPVAQSGTLLTLEAGATGNFISFLHQDAQAAGILIGEGADDDIAGILYDNEIANGWTVRIAGAGRLNYSAGAFTYLEATTIGFGAFNSTISASSAGVARSIAYNITVGAGGAANAQLSEQFQLDTVFEAGLSGETDGSGGVTAATQVWKVPYRDSGINVAAPAALNVEVLGGLRVEAGDDTNRIYFRANEAWHYINQTAGLSIRADERVDPWTGHRWELDDLALVKMHKDYGDGGGDFLPYPLEEGLRETLLQLLDVDVEFRRQVKEKLGV